MRLHFFVLLLALNLCSCDKNRVFDQNINFEKQEWTEKTALDFKFKVEDSTVPYDLFYNVRYTNTYPYYNLYIGYILKDSTGKEIKRNIPQNMDLFNATTGEPYGKGLGDLFECSILGLSSFKFPNKGMYTMQVKQYMRKDPISGIASFGLKVEKSETAKE